MSELHSPRGVSDRTCVPAPAGTTYLCFPNHRVEASSVDHHAFERYLCLSVAMQSGELMYLPVKRLHLWAKSLVANLKIKRRGKSGYIDESMHPHREGTSVFLSPCRAVR